MLESAPLSHTAGRLQDACVAREAPEPMSSPEPAASPVAPTPFKAWWKASRPATLSIAVVPVLIGTALAKQGSPGGLDD